MTGRDKDGTGSGVGGDRFVDGIQLEKRSRRLDMAKSCSWWTEEGTSFMAHDIKLIPWTMRSAGDTVSWVR